MSSCVFCVWCIEFRYFRWLYTVSGWGLTWVECFVFRMVVTFGFDSCTCDCASRLYICGLVSYGFVCVIYMCWILLLTFEWLDIE